MTDEPSWAFHDIPLAVALPPEAGRIGTVGRQRHTAFWAECAPQESLLTYCNNCGGSVVLSQSFEFSGQLVDLNTCGDCGVFMGWGE